MMMMMMMLLEYKCITCLIRVKPQALPTEEQKADDF